MSEDITFDDVLKKRFEKTPASVSTEDLEGIIGYDLKYYQDSSTNFNEHLAKVKQYSEAMNNWHTKLVSDLQLMFDKQAFATHRSLSDKEEIAAKQIKIEELEMHNELLIKALPAIHFKPGIVEATDEDRIKIVEVALSGAATLLKKTFDMLDLKTHVNGTVIYEDTGEHFRLTFELIPSPPKP